MKELEEKLRPSKYIDKKYVDFKIAPYALAKILLALDNCGIEVFTITQEDNDLHIRIDIERVKDAVYPRTKNNEEYDLLKEVLL